MCFVMGVDLLTMLPLNVGRAVGCSSRTVQGQVTERDPVNRPMRREGLLAILNL